MEKTTIVSEDRAAGEEEGGEEHKWNREQFLLAIEARRDERPNLPGHPTATRR